MLIGLCSGEHCESARSLPLPVLRLSGILPDGSLRRIWHEQRTSFRSNGGVCLSVKGFEFRYRVFSVGVMQGNAAAG